MKRYLLTCVLLVLAASHVNAASYFVSTSGSDTNPGTEAAPWGSVDKVNTIKFLPGDSVYFRSGDAFCGFLRPEISGEEGKPIVFDAYGAGAYPVISACKKNQYALVISGRSYLTVNHLVFTEGTIAAGWVSIGAGSSKVSNVTFNFDTFENSISAGLFIYGPDGSACNEIQVLNSTVTGNAGSGIIDACPGDSITIQGNTVTYNVSSSSTFGAGIRVVSDGKSDANRQTNVHVLGNKVFYNGIGSGGFSNLTGVGIHMDTTGTGMVVAGNDVENNASQGIQIEWAGTKGSHLVQGNTVIGNGAHGIVVYQRSWGVQVIQNTAALNADNFFIEGRYGGEDVGMKNNYLSQNWGFSPKGGVSFGAMDGADNDGKNGSGNVYSNNCWGPDGPGHFRWGGNYYNTVAQLATASNNQALSTCSASQGELN